MMILIYLFKFRDELEDIDMSVSLVESPVEGAVVGKTISCILVCFNDLCFMILV